MAALAEGVVGAAVDEVGYIATEVGRQLSSKFSVPFKRLKRKIRSYEQGVIQEIENNEEKFFKHVLGKDQQENKGAVQVLRSNPKPAKRLRKRHRVDYGGDPPSNAVVATVGPSEEKSKSKYSFWKSYRIGNMPYARRRRYGRRKRRFRKRKYVTKRGVSRLIRSSVADGMSKVSWSIHNHGICYGDFNRKGFQVIPFNQLFGTYGDIDRIWDTINQYTKTVPSSAFDAAGKPQSTSQILSMPSMLTFTMHNPMSEVVMANIWWIAPRQDSQVSSAIAEWWRGSTIPYNPATLTYDFAHASLGPLYRWFVEYGEYDSFGAASTFQQDFTSGPTVYRQWNKEFRIIKKYTVSFAPGQTKILRLKMPGFRFNTKDEGVSLGSTSAHMFKYSRWLMMETKGVPTHQNSDSTETNISVVGRTRTGLEFVYENKRYIKGVTQLPVLWETKAFGYDTVTAAQALIPETSGTVRSV